MSIITYSRNKEQPELLYLPLPHGGYIQLQEGTHQYADHAGHGLKNSTNPVVKKMIRDGNVIVNLESGINLGINNPGIPRQFAPLGAKDFRTETRNYAPIKTDKETAVKDEYESHIEALVSEDPIESNLIDNNIENSNQNLNDNLTGNSNDNLEDPHIQKPRTSKKSKANDKL